MKLAIVTSGFLPVPASKGGAVENLIVNLLNENEKSKDDSMDVVVFSTFDEKAVDQAKKFIKTRVIFIKNPKIIDFSDKIIFLIAKNILKKTNSQSYRFILKRLFFLNKVSKNLKKYNYDKVLLENHPTQFLTLKWRKNYKKYKGKYYYHCHNEFAGTYGCDDIIRQTKKFICVSKYISKFVQRNLNVDETKCVVLKNAIDQSIFLKPLSKERKQKLVDKYNIKSKEKILLFTGRIVPEKGVLELLSALENVKNDYKLLIVGASLNSIKTKTKYEMQVEKKVEKMHNHVIFTGFIEYNKIFEVYQIADIAILPSICNDAAPLTVIEALTCGLPIITTNSGGIPEYATDGSAIIINRDKDLVKNLSRAINSLMSNKGKQTEMSSKAVKVSKKLTTKNYYINFLDIIERY